MKVAYLFATQRHNVSYVLARMILPQLEEGRYGTEVVGMLFFEDNNYVLMDGNPIGACMPSPSRAACCSWVATRAATSARSPIV